jgi:hypothetical protein
MTKEQLAPWIEKLARAKSKNHAAIVGEMCKENGLNADDAWKLLKEAGFDSRAAPPGGEQRVGDTPPAPERKPAKKRVKHESLKGANLIVGDKMIAFDADGIAELDADGAARLLTIPGYTEVPDAQPAK